ncbi:MAG: hypothetical protein IKV88_09205, partial [Clostridia bacterium]|nr:hypothetical protein [Clostridia bacterium]
KNLKEVFRVGSWAPLVEPLGNKCKGVFMKEYNQFKAILQLDEFSEFINDMEYDEKAEEHFTNQIIESLGLTQSDAQCMAKCFCSIRYIKYRLYRSCVFSKKETM